MAMLLDLTLSQLKDKLIEQNLEPYRAKQIFEWIFKKNCMDPSQMSNLPLDLRQWMEPHLKALFLVHTQNSHDGQTHKSLWKLHDANLVESVLIEAPGRQTLCVSSQVGCAARCAFCASGKEGLLRNLSPAEIFEQFTRTQEALRAQGRSLTNLVFMGMGEPLHNYEALVQVIQTLTSPEGAHFSARRITVSTVGISENMYRLADDDLGINLVLSLHAPNQDIRKRIIPIARKYPLEEVFKACDYFSQKSGRDITYEYTMLEGINDAPEHARELADLLGDRQCTVNLIPYNPIEGLKLKRPSKNAIEDFREVLDERGINNTCRYTKGVDIAAACGQLALQKSDSKQQGALKIVQPDPCNFN